MLLSDLPLRNAPCQRKPVPLKCNVYHDTCDTSGLFVFNLTASEQPPRPSPNSHYSLSLAGYWPARGEFAVVGTHTTHK